jgi:hypothetical protein
LREQSIGLHQAEIAVSRDASLGARENREKLLRAVREEYERLNPPLVATLDFAEIREMLEAALKDSGHPHQGDSFIKVH